MPSGQVHVIELIKVSIPFFNLFKNESRQIPSLLPSLALAVSFLWREYFPQQLPF